MKLASLTVIHSVRDQVVRTSLALCTRLLSTKAASETVTQGTWIIGAVAVGALAVVLVAVPKGPVHVWLQCNIQRISAISGNQPPPLTCQDTLLLVSGSAEMTPINLSYPGGPEVETPIPGLEASQYAIVASVQKGYAVATTSPTSTVPAFTLTNPLNQNGSLDTGGAHAIAGIALAGSWAYLTNVNEGRVTDVNVQTGTVGGGVATGSTPEGIAVDAAQGQAIVADGANYGVSLLAINPGSSTGWESTRSTFLSTQSVNADANPSQVAVNPSTNRAYVLFANGGGTTTDPGIAVLQIGATPSQDSLITIIPEVDYPNGIALDGNTAYITSSNNTNLTTINLTTNAVQTIPLGVTTNGIVIDTATQTAYVASIAAQEILPIHLPTDQLGTPIGDVSIGDPGSSEGPVALALANVPA